MEKRSRAAGCELKGILVLDGPHWNDYRVKYSWSHMERNRRNEIKAMELRLRDLDAAGE